MPVCHCDWCIPTDHPIQSDQVCQCFCVYVPLMCPDYPLCAQPSMVIGQCVSTYNTSLSALECPAPHQCPQVARQSFTGDAVQRLPLSSICNPDDFSAQCPASPYTKRCTLGKWWFFFRRKWSPASTAMASWPRSHQCLEIKMSYSLRFWSALKEATLPWF